MVEIAKLLPIRPPPRLLHHYTDTSGLVRMLATGSVSASHVRCMNDFSEYDYGMRIVTEETETFVKERSPNQEFLRALELFHVAKPVREDAAFFAFCLSEKEDDLAQWYSFGGRGYGYSLGFDFSMFVSNNPFFEGALLPIVYDPTEQRRLVWTALETFERQLPGRLGGAEGHKRTVAIGLEAVGLFMVTSFLIAIFKNRAFQEEREWRLILSDFLNLDAARFGYHAGKATIVPHITYALKDLGANCLAKVVQGPLIDKAASSRALDLIRRQHKFDFKVTSSAVPLR